MDIRTTLGGGVVFLTILFLAACSQKVGPSEDKVRLDAQDKIELMTFGLVSITNFEIDNRDVLSEDRVKFHITLSYEIDDEKVKQYEESERQSSRMTGTINRSNMRLVETAQQLNGKTEKATWLYRLSEGGMWQLAQSNTGHN